MREHEHASREGLRQGVANGAFDPYQPNEKGWFFRADQLQPHSFPTAGEYRIRFVYSTKSDSITEWGGDGRDSIAADKRLVNLFRQVPKVEIRSNEIKISVIDPDRNDAELFRIPLPLEQLVERIHKVPLRGLGTVNRNRPGQHGGLRGRSPE